VLTEDAKELAEALGEDVPELEASGDTNTRFIARFDANTSAAEDDRIEVFVDTKMLYFFDPDTGGSIWSKPGKADVDVSGTGAAKE
jgi:outer membrane protein assembly factor BamB